MLTEYFNWVRRLTSKHVKYLEHTIYEDIPDDDDIELYCIQYDWKMQQQYNKNIIQFILYKSIYLLDMVSLRK